MIWRVTFSGREGHALRETVYAADDIKHAIDLIANGTVEIPDGTAEVVIEPEPGQAVAA